ncbi:MAG: hypothetical protein HRU03_04470 [Nanoarchaeales archaeon]|nr:hypothetical protein [Nanoarchaeales archaeon]
MLHHRDFHKSLDALFLRHKWNPEIIEYYVYKVLRNISFALISLFIPIYLYSDLNYSLFEIILFFLINEIFFLIFIPFSGKIIEKLGIKHSILAHLPGMIIFTFGLRFLSGDFYGDLWIICLILLIRVLPKSILTAAEQVFVAKNILNQKGHDGQGLATIRIVLITASLISPLVGGFITFYFGFDMFFNFAIIIMVLAMIPLLLTKDQYFHSTKSPKNILKYFFREVPKNFHIAEGARWSVDSLLWIVWPLFLFVVVQNTKDLGILISVSAVISIGVSYYVGKRIDSKPSKKLFKKMTKISSSIFFLRTIVPNQIVIVFFDSINKILDPILMLPYEKYYYNFIKSNKNILEISIASVLIMEIAYFISLIFLAVYFGVIAYLDIAITYFVFIGLFFSYGLLILLFVKISEIVDDEDEN